MTFTALVVPLEGRSIKPKQSKKPKTFETQSNQTPQFTQEQLDNLSTALRGVEATATFLPTLDKNVRRRFARVGAKTEKFATRAIETGKKLPPSVQTAIPAARIATIVAQRDLLRGLGDTLKQLQRGVDDANIHLSKEFHGAAFSTYETLKRFGSAAGLDEHLAELRNLRRKPARKPKADGNPGTPVPPPPPKAP